MGHNCRSLNRSPGEFRFETAGFLQAEIGIVGAIQTLEDQPQFKWDPRGRSCVAKRQEHLQGLLHLADIAQCMGLDEGQHWIFAQITVALNTTFYQGDTAVEICGI